MFCHFLSSSVATTSSPGCNRFRRSFRKVRQSRKLGEVKAAGECIRELERGGPVRSAELSSSERLAQSVETHRQIAQVPSPRLHWRRRATLVVRNESSHILDRPGIIPGQPKFHPRDRGAPSRVGTIATAFQAGSHRANVGCAEILAYCNRAIAACLSVSTCSRAWRSYSAVPASSSFRLRTKPDRFT